MGENELKIYDLIQDLEELERKEKYWEMNREVRIEDFMEQ